MSTLSRADVSQRQATAYTLLTCDHVTAQHGHNKAISADQSHLHVVTALTRTSQEYSTPALRTSVTVSGTSGSPKLFPNTLTSTPPSVSELFGVMLVTTGRLYDSDAVAMLLKP